MYPNNSQKTDNDNSLNPKLPTQFSSKQSIPTGCANKEKQRRLHKKSSAFKTPAPLVATGQYNTKR